MEVMKGYKRTEVGQLPSDWRVVSLSSVSRKITDGDHLTPKRSVSGYYLLSARNVLNGRIDVSDVDFVGSAEFTRMKQRCGPESGDVLISCSGTIGRVAVVPRGLECVLVRSVALAKLDPDVAVGSFIQFWLQSASAQRQIAGSINQGAQPNLFLNHIERLAVALPPLAEQKAIAEALSDVDDLIASLERLIAKKRDIKTATMGQLLTGRTRLPGFTGEWERKRLGDLYLFSGGLSASRAELGEAGVPYLHYGDIHGSSSTFLDLPRALQTIPRLPVAEGSIPPGARLRHGDVVFVDASEDDAGTSKHVVVLNPANSAFASGLHTIVAKPRVAELDVRFQGYCFQSHDVRSQFRFYAVGTKVSGVSKSSIAKIDVSYPSREEQQAIAAVLSDMDAEIEALESRLAKTRMLKQGMMQELLTGRTRLV